MNIVSLLPSTTEIIFDLGLEDQLKGVTIECNWPAEARAGREIVVDTFTKPGMTPGEIDAIVKERMAAGLDLYNLDDDALARCAPDLILSQDLCRVCAVASGDVDAAIARLRCDATLLHIDPQNLLEVIESINTIAQAAGVSHRGLALTQALHERLLAVAENIKGKTRPAVFVLEWIDPPFGAGHWVPDIIAAAGGEPVLSRPGQRSVQTTWQEITAAAPDVVIVAPCGFNLDGAAEQAHSIAHLLPSSASVWAIDADSVMVRPGPRLVDGVEAIAAMLHNNTTDSDVLRKIR
ncbi:MAG: ABC transporter substrate-binding protein [Ilumatobacteraceae bacterium]|nr:ABC transporter substrate-binding protein [Ilumatobacteraceae bacterium]MDP4702884.1 ABC transporter substrate-binding protein [Ilumatobacteraceae bacterium]